MWLSVSWRFDVVERSVNVTRWRQRSKKRYGWMNKWIVHKGCDGLGGQRKIRRDQRSVLEDRH